MINVASVMSTPMLHGVLHMEKRRMVNDDLVEQFTSGNLVVNSARSVIIGLLKREFSQFMPHYVVLGSGGDLEQGSKVDTGARVPPTVSDTEVRQVITRVPIIQVENDPEFDNQWTYVAIVKPADCIAGNINEFGLEALNHTLIAHFVTAPDAGQERAKKYAKSSIEYLIIKWSFTLNLS